jgi:hypothetical protein
MRGLFFFSGVLGFALVWMTGVRNLLFSPLLGAANWFITFVIAVRFAPYVVPPRLVTSNPEPEQFIKLGLGGGGTRRD